MSTYEIKIGSCLDVLKTLPDESVQCAITSPPYWGLRDYGVPGQLGLEPTPDEYVANMVAVFREVRRALKKDGTLWLNLGDSYATNNTSRSSNEHPSRRQKGTGATEGLRPPRQLGGLKPKDLVGIPWRVAFALQADGWWLRQDIIWAKPNPMPAPVTDRCVSSHEYLFLLAKSERYYFDYKAIREDGTNRVAGNKNGFKRPHRISGGLGDGQEAVVAYEKRNRRSVWVVCPKPFKGAHFATFPPALVEPCVLAGSRPCDVVLDPFNGAGTTGVVALQHGRRYLGIELNPDYVSMSVDRIEQAVQTATPAPAPGSTEVA